MSPSHWTYPLDGLPPPTPIIVTTITDYVTPPPTPPHVYATFTVDDCTPCPRSPCLVPSSPQQDELDRSDSPISEPASWSTSELDSATVFADPLFEPYSPSDHESHVSDNLIYAPEIYASPNPVLIMIQRATLDKSGLLNQPVNPFTCDKPLKLFSLTCGHTPRTGLDDRDHQSFMYYAKYPAPRPFRQPECFLSYSYPISVITTIQRSLCTDWSLVYPSPIPVVIIHLCDIVGPFTLVRRLDGFAFIVPTQDSIWPTICRRGVDSAFRPLDPTATVDNTLCRMGESVHWPQHIVASNFTVNVFLQRGDFTTHCEYMGAYVMQVLEDVTIHSAIWEDIDPEVRYSVYDRVPYRFEGRPYLPYIHFHHYKWDEQLVGLVDEIEIRDAVQLEDVFNSDFGFDTDQEPSTPSVYSPEYTSFLDLSPEDA